MKKYLPTAFVLTAILCCELFGVPGMQLTGAQEISAYIMLIAAVLWVSEWVPLFLVSFLILALEIIWLLPCLVNSGTSLDVSIFYAAFFSNIILLFLGGFVLSSLMQRYGLDIKFAQAILVKTKGKASTTLLGIIFVCAFLSMWVSNTATTAMMLTIILPLLKRIPVEHPFRIALVLSIPFACNIGGIATPIGTPPNAIALSFLASKSLAINFLHWMTLTLPFVLFFLFVLWRLLLGFYPAKGLVLNIETRDSAKLNASAYGAITIFCVTVIGWFFSSQLGLSTGTVALVPIIAAFWFRLLDVTDFRNLPWDILYIISGGLALGVALTASGLGSVLANLLPENANMFVTLLIFSLVAALMSTVMSNTATAGLLIPLVISVDINNSHLMSLILAITLICSMTMALPVTTPPNAIAFSSRAINTKDMLVTGGVMTIIGFIVISTVGPLYWKMIL